MNQTETKPLTTTSTLRRVLSSHLFFFTASMILSMYILKSESSLIACWFKVALSPINVFFHEGSHAIAAFLTGLEIKEFNVTWYSGHVVNTYNLDGSDNYSRIVTTFSGYLGTTLFGGLFFFFSFKNRKAFILSLILIALILTCFYDKIETLQTMSYVIIFLAVFLLPFKKSEKSVGEENSGKLRVFEIVDAALSYLMRFISVFLMMDSLVSPLNELSNGRGLDSKNLVNLLGGQQTYYVYIWMFVSFIFMSLICYFLYRKELIKNKQLNEQIIR
ncbi:M50 family metallopeptidase [Vibrio parahaemolyticus O5:K30]|uniref:M50 family metallopeptidase n=1 Tax=Vibrio vulnificus TaxID=672 RepID=UPI003D9C8B50|nr:M50 family metallopeptidase [Vibrio parahaemolyticus O5:K30]